MAIDKGTRCSESATKCLSALVGYSVALCIYVPGTPEYVSCYYSSSSCAHGNTNGECFSSICTSTCSCFGGDTHRTRIYSSM